MQRILGIFFLMLGSIGLSASYTEGQRERVHLLYEMSEIMNYIKESVEKTGKTLPEIMKEAGRGRSKAFENSFEMIIKSYETEEEKSLSKIYRRIMQKSLRDTTLREEEKEPFLGAFDGEDTRLIEVITGKLQEARQRLYMMAAEEEKNLKRQKNLAYRVGIMGGLMLVLMFV